MESKTAMPSRTELHQMLEVTRSILAIAETKMEYLRVLRNHEKLLKEDGVVVRNEGVVKDEVTVMGDVHPPSRAPIRSEKLGRPRAPPNDDGASAPPNDDGASAPLKRVTKSNPWYRNAEFVCDYFKAAELSPRAKGRAPKRVRLRDMMGSCQTILKKLMNHELGYQIFNRPVNAELEGIPDYHLIINKPMDLGTIQCKLKSRQYPSPREFAGDVRLTFTNAKKYNADTHEVHQIACSLEALFEEWWEAMVVKVEAHEDHVQRRNNNNNNNHRRLLQGDPKGIGVCGGKRKRSRPQLAKPRPVDLCKRPLTIDEKVELHHDLESLPQDKMDQVEEILKRSSHFSRTATFTNDVVEIDLYNLDTDTLWELHHFISNYLPIANKKKTEKGSVNGR